ncbi:HpcH/HpaI aldolase/citrate lyase family protein [Sphingomonas crusticola]|uniref:HpcH/HpaI aldolase/citrate lyase family protein n=1 Tax=Sphingomonas crusticola TaxID=1697973 RepID=UPI000E281449|nr:CoA ester lyase [Sphingomonas crusticola]
MRLRSLLFVPGDRPDRMEKALSSGADALILDLEDAVAPARKAEARLAVTSFLQRDRFIPLLVRINPLGSPYIDDDLAAIRATHADAIMLPKAEGAASIRALANWTGLPILPIATETPSAIFALGSYRDVVDRLFGLTWGAEDLPAAIGATTAREPDGRYTAPIETVRSLALFAAHSAGVAAIETVYPAFRDLDGLAAYAERGARDGFTGMMAIHPDQVRVINQAFTPGDAEVAAARAIVAAFAAEPEAGVLAVDGKMVDAPHLAQARRVLARAGEGA